MTVNLELLNEIIAGIESGELRHSQDDYHCGSTHCLAGWVIVKELARRGLPAVFTEEGGWVDEEGEIYNLSPIEFAYKDNPFGFDESWLAAKEILGLNQAEAFLLFESCTTFAQIKSMRDRFERGERVPSLEEL